MYELRANQAMRAQFEYERDKDCDSFEQEQWYLNFVDGGMFCPILIEDDHTIIIEADGSIEKWSTDDDMIFNDESVWKDIIPVKLNNYEFTQQ